MGLLLQYFFITMIGVNNYYNVVQSKVTFESNASVEKIIASSNELKGLLNPQNNSFSFSINLISFYGFNSALQKDHYIENYVETDFFPNATFKGKIIEPIDFSRPGDYDVRAKGVFELHGVRVTKIINGKLKVTDASHLQIHADFEINLTEYSIRVPRLVHKKIAETLGIVCDIKMNK